MVRKLELTWAKAQRRWKKYYKGKVYYFKHGNGKSDLEGYRAALADWQAKKAELDGAAEAIEPDLSQFEAGKRRVYWDNVRVGMQWAKAFDEMRGTDDPDKAASVIDDLQSMLDSGKLPPVPSSAPLADDAENNIEVNAKRFLALKKADVSRGRLEVLRASLNHFLDFIGRDQTIQAITSVAVEEFYVGQRSLVDSERISSSTGRDRLAAAKAFVNWLDEHEKIRAPRNLGRFNIPKTVREVETVPLADLKAMLASATNVTKLYLLLSLNCGMQQRDIALLKQSQVDWKQGRIIRKRVKTASYKNVPKVNYRLWEETFTLLKEQRAKNSELVLLNEKGGSLLTEKDSDDGRYQKNDNIKTAYSRLCRKLNLRYPFKLLRKTAASELASSAEFARFAQYFLGHAPSNVADASYVKQSQEEFDKALRWLGKRFGC